MATLTVQEIDQDGLTPSEASAASGGDQFVADSNQRHFLYVNNGGGGSITVTIAKQQATAQQSGVGQVAVSDLSAAVGAGAIGLIGPITDAYIRGNDGAVEITYSGVTSVTVAALKLPRVAA